MRGLLLKDFYIIKDGLLVLILTFIAVGTGMTFLISPWVLIVVAATTFSMTTVTTIQDDKATQWNKFSVTLPVSRSKVISSKYTMYMILCIAGIILGIIVSVIATIIKDSFDVNSLFIYIFISVIVSVLPGSVSIPSSFILDEQKSIVGLLLSYIVTSGLFAGIIILLSRFIDIKENILFVCGIIALFSLIAYMISWLMGSKKLCCKDL